MMVPIGRALTAGEQPILDAHGLSMWAYVVLVALADEPVRTQAALADAIRADKTRIIPVLDDLQQRGLIERSPDPADRRSHLLSLTTAGRRCTRPRARASARTSVDCSIGCRRPNAAVCSGRSRLTLVAVVGRADLARIRRLTRPDGPDV